MVFPSTNSLASSHFFVIATRLILLYVVIALVPDNTHPLL